MLRSLFVGAVLPIFRIIFLSSSSLHTQKHTFTQNKDYVVWLRFRFDATGGCVQAYQQQQRNRRYCDDVSSGSRRHQVSRRSCRYQGRSNTSVLHDPTFTAPSRRQYIRVIIALFHIRIWQHLQAHSHLHQTTAPADVSIHLYLMN